jgi:GTP cyclohydrolase IA
MIDDHDVHQATMFLTGLWPQQPWESEHMKRTPERFAKMLQELSTPEEFEFTTFESDSDEMIVCKDITFHSLCAHHIVPYIGTAHVAYIPQGRIVGLSKIPRTVRYHAAGLTVQEELTKHIADYMEENLNPLGVAVVMQAEHMCATLRGVKAPGMMTVTSAMRGRFGDHDRLARSEFLAFIQSSL